MEIRPIERLSQFISGGPMFKAATEQAATLEDLFQQAVLSRGDISEHLATLRAYAGVCTSILELGVSYGASSVAFLAALPGTLVSIDIDWSHLPVRTVECAPDSVRWIRVQGDSRSTKTALGYVSSGFDLVFIDTRHTADQVRAEIAAWEQYATRWMIFHDTASYAFGLEGEDGGPGINLPIRDAIESGVWTVREHRENNNGLTVLERKR